MKFKNLHNQEKPLVIGNICIIGPNSLFGEPQSKYGNIWLQDGPSPYWIEILNPVNGYYGTVKKIEWYICKKI